MWTQPSWISESHINENGNSMAIYVPFQFNLFLALENCFLSYLWSYVKTIPWCARNSHLWFLIDTTKKGIFAKVAVKWFQIRIIFNSNITSFFRFVNKRAIYRLGINSLAHAPVVNVHVDELSSARIWQHKLCATLSTNVNINYRLPIKVYYRICTLRHIRIEIIHGSQNVFWLLTRVGGY